MIKATVHVTLKPSVLDPQGEAVKNAIKGLGMSAIQSVRIGKAIELEIDAADSTQVQARLEEISHDLLSNPVIEDYSIEYHNA